MCTHARTRANICPPTLGHNPQDDASDGLVREAPMSYFRYAMSVVANMLKTRIFSNPDDEFALLFFNTVRRPFGKKNISFQCILGHEKVFEYTPQVLKARPSSRTRLRFNVWHRLPAAVLLF